METRKSTSRSGSRRRESTTAPISEGMEVESTSTPGSGLAGKVKERATAQLSAQKDRATDGLGSIAHAVRQTSERLRDDQHGTIAQYVEQAAEQLERLSNNLREKDVNELLQDARRLARRQPALFVGGSFAVGLLAARFLKSSQDRDRDDVSSSEWNTRAADPYTDDQPRGSY